MYGQYYPSYQQQSYQPQSYQPSTDERIWVQNEAAADAYLVAPSGFVRLWDASKPIFYEKRADATGRPLPMEAYEYTRRSSVEEQKQAQMNIDIGNEINELTRRIEALEKGARRNVKSKSDDDVTEI